ncbi:hypothetical protein PtA15_16A43 [Puccinia triticina]|uniref:Protein kinase domain-containing protein n=1 Tax=Puccinia triticina TaxID=208348 RepID=A0ABY7D633_9BASI|nr:uncharacterized protein PtA15_16A43 [Puccinia triticina]WAQ92137.1 hypothetical protein PtA15_16A43 [Puccinia triticina]
MLTYHPATHSQRSKQINGGPGLRLADGRATRDRLRRPLGTAPLALSSALNSSLDPSIPLAKKRSRSRKSCKINNSKSVASFSSFPPDLLTCIYARPQNREFRIMKLLIHPNVVDLRAYFYSSGDKKPDESIRLITTDPVNQTYWLYSEQSISKLVVKNEGRDIWKVYLARKDCKKALSHVDMAIDRDKILVSQANHYLQTGKHISAAQIYAQCSKPFEEVVLGFIDRGERDALRYYLISRLEQLKRQDLTQQMMLANWLTEIYLAKINELEALVGADPLAADQTANIVVKQQLIEDELQQFLRTYKIESLTFSPGRRGAKRNEVFLNLVIEDVPETVYRASRHYSKLKQVMPILNIKLYVYQLLQLLAYIHSLGICHRDIKPQNLLLTGGLELYGFGSAKILVAGEPNFSYICLSKSLL